MVDEILLFNVFYFPGAVTVKEVGLHLDTAPVGANLTVDLLKDDVEQSRIATLNDGSRDQVTNITDINYSTAEKFGIKVKSIGLTIAGEGGTITIHYQ